MAAIATKENTAVLNRYFDYEPAIFCIKEILSFFTSNLSLFNQRNLTYTMTKSNDNIFYNFNSGIIDYLVLFLIISL